MCLKTLFLLFSATAVEAAHWAVIAAGSRGYSNYRHQADACHAYQLMLAKGIPASNIILMMYDDVANSEENPFPGKLFNKPDPDGPGRDVYAGCKVDYRGEDVTPKNFMNVLLGEGQGKVLKSTADDHVFITFIDHGAPGLIAFPSEELHKKQLQSTLSRMSEAKMFKQLVFYLEACYSGSMFQNLSVPEVYAVSAANAHESSWATYCGAQAKVNGKSIYSCLGDLFSVSWMEDSDAEDTTKETLAQQFATVKRLTNLSHVMKYGEIDFMAETVSEFLGNQEQGAMLGIQRTPDPANWEPMSTRKTDLSRLYTAYHHAETAHERVAWGAKLSRELEMQQAAETIYRKFAALVYPGDETKQEQLYTRTEEPDNMECELEAHNAFLTKCAGLFDANSGFALSFHQVVVNVCADVRSGLKFAVRAAAEQVCAEGVRQSSRSEEPIIV